MCTTFSLLREWTDYLGAVERSPNTIRQYRRGLITFVADTGLDLREVTEADVIAHLATLTDKAGTKAQRLRILSGFYRWAATRGRVVENPTALLTLRRKAPGPAPFSTSEELYRLFLAAWEHRPHDPRRPLAIVFLFTTGARIGSACEVCAEDCRPGEVIFRVAKNDRPYRVPLSPLGQWAVDELLRLRAWTNPLALGRRPTLLGVGPGRLWQWVNDASRESGVKAWPHLMRHTFATEAAPLTDPSTWADLMNHADLSQYKRYAGVPEQRKREAAARMWGH